MGDDAKDRWNNLVSFGFKRIVKNRLHATVQIALVATITFAISLATGCARSVNLGDLETPPSLSTVVKEAPEVPFCQLVQTPTLYNGIVVRTSAAFHRNSENAVLSSDGCAHDSNLTWAVFDPSNIYTDERIMKEFEKLICAVPGCRNGRAIVTVVGRFEGPNESGYGHLNGYRFQFAIMRIEKVEPSIAN